MNGGVDAVFAAFNEDEGFLGGEGFLEHEALKFGGEGVAPFGLLDEGFVLFCVEDGFVGWHGWYICVMVYRECQQ